MFQDFIFPTTDSEAEVVEIAIFSAESLKAMAKIFDPMAIFELLEFDPSFFTKLIEILDKTEKNQHDFLCPCIDFFNDLISLEYVETSIFFKLGLLDTISILLDNKSNDKIRSKALETLASIPYEYNTSKNYESEIFLSFSNIFLEIMKGPICEV